ncbi:amidohydrolase family protein [Streptomyces sp. NPDC048342]|uniref:amidohydrolase family protein n=1 Tax=unclassified Streptomyces TaxID=2593676 RepID=UPI00343D9279
MTDSASRDLVDCHTHTLPRRWPDLAERYADNRWPVRRKIDDCSAELFVGGKHFRTVPDTCWNPAARIEQMDSMGVARQWLSVTPVMFSYWAPPHHCAEMARHVNDSIAEMTRYSPQRFVGLATLPMGAPDLAVKELERAVCELGLRGVEIGTNIAGRELDDPEFLPVFEAIAELDVPVLVHPWDVRSADRLARYNAMYTVGMPTETAYAALALLQGGVLDRTRGLRVLLAHGAGALAWLLPRIDRGWRTWPKLRGGTAEPPGTVARRLWADSLAGDETNIRLVGQRIGWDHIVLGTDYPFPFGEQRPGDVVHESSLDESVKSAILYGNASALLCGKSEERTAPA